MPDAPAALAADAPEAAAPDAPKKRRILPVVLAVTVALMAGAATALTPAGSLAGALGRSPADSLAAAEIPFGAFVDLDAVVINPAETGGRRYLMVRVGVEAASPKTLERLDALRPAANDALLTIFGRRTVAELADIGQRDALKEEVRVALNRMLGKDGPVTRIYFTQYVLQ